MSRGGQSGPPFVTIRDAESIVFLIYSSKGVSDPSPLQEVVMRHKGCMLAAGLLVLLGCSLTRADEKATCGKHGTSVEFVDSPAEAAKIAKKEQKLVFVLHVSGYFEDPNLT